MPFCFNNLQKVKVDDRNAKGESARALALMYGYTKIVSLIDSRSPRIKAGISLFKDFSKFIFLLRIPLFYIFLFVWDLSCQDTLKT